MQSSPLSHSIIIEASAGSGKTYQLINRLVQLLLNGAKAANIVAITFTRKAASEMQVRLQERLYELAILDKAALNEALIQIGLQPSPQLIANARQLYEQVIFSAQSVRCTTFHSFCQEILKRFPFEAEVPPGFELTDQAYLHKQQAWLALMAECQGKTNPNVSQAIAFLFAEFGLSTTRDILNNFLNQRSDWWAWTQNANNPVGLAISKMQELFQVDPNSNPLDVFFKNELLTQRLVQFSERIEKLKAAKFKIWLTAIGDARNPNSDLTERYTSLQNAFLTGSGEPRSLKATKEMTTLFGESDTESFIQCHYEICQQITDLQDALNLLNNYKINKQWYIAGNAYLNYYQQIKKSLRLLDFTDLEWQTYCLLNKSQHALWVQYKLDSRIDHLLIDEFQDTNPVQWRLLQPLIDEFNQQQDNNRSVLIVGDSKQSIYRFRRAEPKLFPIASEFIKQNFNSQRMQLNTSWRSSPAIIDFVNKIFTETRLAEAISEFPLHQTELTNLSGSVTLLDYPEIPEIDNQKSDSFRNPLQQPRPTSQSEHALEAKKIADKIMSLINSDECIIENGKSRSIGYQDIIILLRNRTNAAHYEKALHKLNIPFIGSERGTLLDCLEVNDIIMLLNWLITPFNNIALASILRSPLFSISDHNLIEIAQIHSKDTSQSNWFDKIKILLTQKKPEPKLEKAVGLLQRWQAIATKIPVHDLLDIIYSEADILNQYHHAYPAHLKSRTQTNLTRLIELALKVDSGRYPSLQQFIAHISQLKTLTDEAPDTPAASHDKNRVQVMTIHASKGLEAAVIFLANADAGSDDRDKYTYKTIIDWPAEQDEPTIMLLANNSKCRDKITTSLIDKDSAAQKRETANLFYVAVTRARQHLYISAAKQTKSQADWYSLIRQCYALEPDKQGEIILQKNIFKTSPIVNNASVTNTIQTIIDKRMKQTIDVKTVFNDLQKTISPSKSIADKMLLGQIQKNRPNTEIKTDITPLTSDVDATNRGIIIHSIFEAINSHSKLDKMVCKNIYGKKTTDILWDEYWQEVQQVITAEEFAFIFSTKNESYNEVSISYLDNDATIYGIIDRIVITDKTIYIIDYKTHQSVNNQNILHYALHYQTQLMHYQQAAQHLWPEHSIKSYLLFTYSKLLHRY